MCIIQDSRDGPLEHTRLAISSALPPIPRTVGAPWIRWSFEGGRFANSYFEPTPNYVAFIKTGQTVESGRFPIEYAKFLG